jgi:hypothetical protein
MCKATTLTLTKKTLHTGWTRTYDHGTTLPTRLPLNGPNYSHVSSFFTLARSSKCKPVRLSNGVFSLLLIITIAVRYIYIIANSNSSTPVGNGNLLHRVKRNCAGTYECKLNIPTYYIVTYT